MEFQVDPQDYKKQSSRRTNELSFNSTKKAEKIGKKSSNLRIEVNGKLYHPSSTLCVAEAILFELSSNPKFSFVKLEGVIPIENINLFNAICVESSHFFMSPEFSHKIQEEIQKTNDDFKQTISLSSTINDDLKKMIGDEKLMRVINHYLLKNSMKLLCTTIKENVVTFIIEAEQPVEKLDIHELISICKASIKQNESMVPSAAYNSKSMHQSFMSQSRKEELNSDKLFKIPTQTPQRHIQGTQSENEESKDKSYKDFEASNELDRLDQLVNNFCGESKNYVDPAEIKAKFINQRPLQIKTQRKLFTSDAELRKGKSFTMGLLSPHCQMGVNNTWITEVEDKMNTISILPSKPTYGFKDPKTSFVFNNAITQAFLKVASPKFQKSEKGQRCQDFYTVLIEDYLKEIKKNYNLSAVSQADSKEFELQLKKSISSLELLRILYLNPRANQSQSKALYVSLDDRRENLFRKKLLIIWLINEIEQVPEGINNKYLRILTLIVKGQIEKANQTCIDEDLWEISNLLSTDNNDGMINYLEKSLKPSISKIEKRTIIIYNLLVKKEADFKSLKAIIPSLTWKEVLLCHLIYFNKELNESTLLAFQELVLSNKESFSVDFNFYLIMFFAAPSENILLEMAKPSTRHKLNTTATLPYIVFLVLSEIYLKIWKDCTQRILSFENSLKQ